MEQPEASLVYELRELTGLPVRDCVEALRDVPAGDRAAFIAKVRANPHSIGPPPYIRLPTLNAMPRDNEHGRE